MSSHGESFFGKLQKEDKSEEEDQLKSKDISSDSKE
jgi:hypothetical protein